MFIQLKKKKFRKTSFYFEINPELKKTFFQQKN